MTRTAIRHIARVPFAIGPLMLAAGCEDGVLPLSRSEMKPAATAARALFPDSCMDPPDGARLVSAMLDAINRERAKRDLSPLRPSNDLEQIADFYACRLIEGAFFSHRDPFEGSTLDVRAANFGYAFWKIGENLAAGQPTVDAAMAELMASPRHRANILDAAYTEIGISVKIGGDLGIYWVQEFGRPVSESPDSVTDQGGSEHPHPSASSAPTSKPGA
ncbi:Cysteine-rich secretory protein family protein [Phycisphaerae bacterium RAS2]|nr:Cysteine-rich secretory protein family protein [Phycisphaerae bacterium RAS2]